MRNNLTLAGLTFKNSGKVNVSLGKTDVEMDEYLARVDFDLIVWAEPNKNRAFVYYEDQSGCISKKTSKKFLPKKIQSIKDETLFFERATTYLAKKVTKELSKTYKKVELRKV